tara:strand:- start:17034 stop:17312 length:279 start_codon:yes stop_codon:yes gene_type:complete
MDIEKILREYNFKYVDDRTDYEVYLDGMYQAYTIEKEAHNERDVLDKADYYEANQDFLISHYHENFVNEDIEYSDSIKINKDGVLVEDPKHN